MSSMNAISFNNKLHPFLHASVAFTEDKCMIMVNALPAKVSFYIEGRNIFAGAGVCLTFPELDDAARSATFDRILEIHTKDPNKVFVVEFGPHGPLAEHSIS
jgi:hypothetical protein